MVKVIFSIFLTLNSKIKNMKKKSLIFTILSVLVYSCSHNDDIETVKTKEENNKIYIPEISQSVTINNGRLVFDNDGELASFIEGINAKASVATTRMNTDSARYYESTPIDELTIDNEEFSSLYTEFVNAMNEAEDYCDTEEGYYAFKAKYPSLYYAEQPDDYSAYLPVSNELLAKYLNKKGEIEIGGKVQNLRDIHDYQQIIDLGLVPQDELSPLGRAESRVNYFYERCNNRKLWVKVRVEPSKTDGVFRDAVFDVSFRKKGAFGAWYNYSSETTLESAKFGVSHKSGYSAHKHRFWMTPRYSGKASIQFRGFGKKCGGTKYEFDYDLSY